MKPIQRQKTQFSTSPDNSNRFDDLLKAIEQREVLLIVGKGFEIDSLSEDNKPIFDSLDLPEGSDIYDLLLAQLKLDYNSDAIDFSELNEDANFSRKEGTIKRKENIYNVVSQTLLDFDLQPKDTLKELRDLISTGYFRFVFSASFSPVLEMLMKEQWGKENVRVLNIMDKWNNDIQDSVNDLLTPTVYYLFGKANSNEEFVVTDNDILKVLRRWQWDMRDSKIIESTMNKYILALGCDHDDWLFRFIWYTLKGANNIAHGSVCQYANNESLERYLRRNNILENKDAKKFVHKIIEGLKNRKNDYYLHTTPSTCDVFLSYARKDGDVADALYKALSKKGLNVWYDKYNLGGKGGDFMEKIYTAIENCKMFVPILSPTITEQRKDPEGHPYRLEWKYAKNHLIGKHGWDDCIPVFDQDYDLYKAKEEDHLPFEFPKLDAKSYNRFLLDFEEVSNTIQKILL